MSIVSRLRNAWDIFMERDSMTRDYGMSDYSRPDRIRLSRGNERSIITSVINRIALDCASVDVNHVRTDENGRFMSIIDSSLNECFTLSANLDQTGRALIQDIVMSMLDEGCVAIVPVVTDTDINDHDSFDIYSLRTGKIVEWYPRWIKAEVYNENTGQKECVMIEKEKVAIVENPLYAIMNEPNSTLKRLTRKLALLDDVDEQSSSGKLNLILQLPYVAKSALRKEQANLRRAEVEDQLKNSKYGVAYTDGTEKIIQLNRPVENNLMSQVEYLTNLLYSQLGITQEIMNGTCDEKHMINYFDRTIEPIMTAITVECKRKFLTKTAITRNQSIMFFRNPFKLVSMSEIAEIADKFTRNEIMTTNDIRQIIGMKPSDSPNADELRNKNIAVESTSADNSISKSDSSAQIAERDDLVNKTLDDIDKEINDIVLKYTGNEE